MDNRSIEGRILATLRVILKRVLEFGVETTRENTETWDSLKHVELIFALEDEFCVEFSSEELSELNSVMQIAALIRAKNAT